MKKFLQLVATVKYFFQNFSPHLKSILLNNIKTATSPHFPSHLLNITKWPLKKLPLRPLHTL